MDYIYAYENQAKQLKTKDLPDKRSVNYLHILCYYITTTAKYPFLLFLMEKTPYCNGFVEEQFSFPFIAFDKNTNISNAVLNKVLEFFKNTINEDDFFSLSYKGIITLSGSYYALVNITQLKHNIDKYLTRNSPYWFVLPTEIINTKHVCNINIDRLATDLFVRELHIALLTDTKKGTNYILPDVVYTGNEYKIVEFYSIFGNGKTDEYELSDQHYYFYSSYFDAVRRGGWNKEGIIKDSTCKKETHNASGRLIVENDYGRYIMGGINRYALFMETQYFIEDNKLPEKMNELKNEEMTLGIFSYSYDNLTLPNLLVQTDDTNVFVSLSYHKLDKTTLGEQYSQENKSKYMIL